jgi:hypothetical protein
MYQLRSQTGSMAVRRHSRFWLTAATLVVLMATTHPSSSAQGKPTPKAQAVDWGRLVPLIPAALGNKFDGCDADDIEVMDTADFSGEGGSVALVDYCHIGAYMDTLTVLRVENGKPVQARFRDEHGKPVDTDFLDGASVMHGAGLQLVPEEHAVLEIYWNAEDAENARAAQHSDQTTDAPKQPIPQVSCGATAYRWNPQSKTFDIDCKLSQKLMASECRKVQHEFECEDHPCPPEPH